ncbi:hypothetical protein LR48_Vigan06g112800 [Vigna angularis]|uniref:Uncharacterized protein n=1 Tax=Phaseolus angularis TaxID=3914 RepID=A0A0L9UTA6_PHAAN|nr:hypothetical protein LR48_Vigan06g112800 [Vigna angularis]
MHVKVHDIGEDVEGQLPEHGEDGEDDIIGGGVGDVDDDIIGGVGDVQDEFDVSSWVGSDEDASVNEDDLEDVILEGDDLEDVILEGDEEPEQEEYEGSLFAEVGTRSGCPTPNKHENERPIHARPARTGRSPCGRKYVQWTLVQRSERPVRQKRTLVQRSQRPIRQKRRLVQRTKRTLVHNRLVDARHREVGRSSTLSGCCFSTCDSPVSKTNNHSLTLRRRPHQQNNPNPKNEPQSEKRTGIRHPPQTKQTTKGTPPQRPSSPQKTTIVTQHRAPTSHQPNNEGHPYLSSPL